MAVVKMHPQFLRQLELLMADERTIELAGEIVQLVSALEEHGNEVEGVSDDDPSDRCYQRYVPEIDHQYVPDWERRNPGSIARRRRR